MRRRIRRAGAVALAAVTAAFAALAPQDEAALTITAEDLRAHLYYLSHDLLEGRGTGTRGGRLAANYIAAQFMRSGVQPVRGAYFQRVPIVGLTADTGGLSLSFARGGRRIAAEYPRNAVFWSGGAAAPSELNAELVFVGYGVDAPEYRWDDFKGQDLRGKVLLFLVNDPPAPPDDAERFGGPAMTYYGRWSYKFEEAERRGAAGALVIHTTDAAGYPWSVVESSFTGEQFALPRDSADPAPLALRGWIGYDLAKRVLDQAGLRIEELYVRAARRDFRPVATGIEVRAQVPTRARRMETANVVGIVPGRGPRAQEVVVYTSHYDHLGIGPAVDGDSIYNGAYDNASGVSGLLEVAEAFASMEQRPARTMLFLATGAEEAGMLGAEHYVRRPLFPLDRTVAAINLDGLNLWGETDDVVGLGAERSTLGMVLEQRARAMGMRMEGDRAPEKGFFFRSDHFPFARAGVPALYIEHGLRYRGRPADWGTNLLQEYDARHYHQPSDAYAPGLDLAGAVQHARLAFFVGYDVAARAEPPRWFETAEFRR